MSRFARVFAAIWDDDDFLALGSPAQRLYLALVSQPNLSHCGVLPLSVRRWARLATDTDADSVRSALDELCRARFVIVDDDTEEVMIRSWMKHDELHRVPNGRRAIETACSQVVSRRLRELCAATFRDLTATVAATHPERVIATHPERDSPPQQPAASSQTLQPDPAAAAAAGPTRQPSATRRDRRTDPPLPAAAAAVVELAIEVRRQASNGTIRNPTRWTKALRRDLTADDGPTITARLDAGDDPVEIVAALTGATRNDVIRVQAQGDPL